MRIAFRFSISSPDGQYVICGSHDGSIFVWDASTARLEKVLKEHRYVNSPWFKFVNPRTDKDHTT